VPWNRSSAGRAVTKKIHQLDHRRHRLRLHSPKPFCVKPFCVKPFCVKPFCVKPFCVKLFCVKLFCVKLFCVKLLSDNFPPRRSQTERLDAEVRTRRSLTQKSGRRTAAPAAQQLTRLRQLQLLW